MKNNIPVSELKEALSFLQENLTEMQSVINSLQKAIKVVDFHPRDQFGHFLPKKRVAYFRYQKDGAEPTWRELIVDEEHSDDFVLCGNDLLRDGGYRCFKRENVSNLTVEEHFVDGLEIVKP